MFLAPLLYLVHAVLTGLSMMLMHALGVHLGFSFRRWPIRLRTQLRQIHTSMAVDSGGSGYFALYYAVFRWVIGHFDLPTPGRERAARRYRRRQYGRTGVAALISSSQHSAAQNLQAVDACTTRLRLTVRNSAMLDGSVLAALGAMGVVKPSKTAAQVILGPIADQIAGEIRARLGEVSATAEPTLPPVSTTLAAALAGCIATGSDGRP
jgi:PTS system N-acetylglucosamine-specific IIC component